MVKPTCPMCKKAPPAADYRPFCSRRCADQDLQAWFSGSYAIPAIEQEQDSTLIGDSDE